MSSVLQLVPLRLAGGESSKRETPSRAELRRWRTELPNLLFELGLSAHAIALYAVIRRTAGEHGSCFMNSDRLAEKCGMCVGKVSRAKQELTRPRAELNGLSLVTIKPRSPLEGKGRKYRRATSRKDRIGRGRTGDSMRVNDVWAENYRHFTRRAEEAAAREQSESETGDE